MPTSPLLEYADDDRGVGGSASPDTKRFVAGVLPTVWRSRAAGFADPVGQRLRITEVHIDPLEEAPRRLNAKVIAEIEVVEDMLNGGGVLHGGCAAYLIGCCSTLPTAALDYASGGPGKVGVSQSVTITYHAPAVLGAKLRIISTSLSVGARVSSSRGEIWDSTRQRLVATGIHVKTGSGDMHESKPKL